MVKGTQCNEPPFALGQMTRHAQTSLQPLELTYSTKASNTPTASCSLGLINKLLPIERTDMADHRLLGRAGSH